MDKKPNHAFLRIVSLVAVCLLSFSSLLTFGDRIASKPDSAGFWMIFAFGLTVGAALVGIPVLIKKSKE